MHGPLPRQIQHNPSCGQLDSLPEIVKNAKSPARLEYVQMCFASRIKLILDSHILKMKQGVYV
jgi:hypothetical protein